MLFYFAGQHIDGVDAEDAQEAINEETVDDELEIDFNVGLDGDGGVHQRHLRHLQHHLGGARVARSCSQRRVRTEALPRDARGLHRVRRRVLQGWSKKWAPGCVIPCPEMLLRVHAT